MAPLWGVAIPAPGDPLSSPPPTMCSDLPAGSFPAPPHLQTLACYNFNVILLVVEEAVPGARGRHVAHLACPGRPAPNLGGMFFLQCFSFKGVFPQASEDLLGLQLLQPLTPFSSGCTLNFHQLLETLTPRYWPCLGTAPPGVLVPPCQP